MNCVFINDDEESIEPGKAEVLRGDDEAIALAMANAEADGE
jgi:hypothetical protein